MCHNKAGEEMKQQVYRIRNWLLTRYLRIRHRRFLPVYAMPTDWAAEDLILAVALNVLKIEAWSVRSDGLSFDIPPDCFHEHYQKAYSALLTRYGTIYPLIRARLQQVFGVQSGRSGTATRGDFILAHRKHQVEATFHTDRIDFRVTNVQPFDMNKMNERSETCFDTRHLTTSA